ncbi:MAG: hypothetical protein M3081_08580 [Gemmatimonadota bacterium]|nr:hypothetical protein [Gemmatimonadota bacterium]
MRFTAMMAGVTALGISGGCGSQQHSGNGSAEPVATRVVTGSGTMQRMSSAPRTMATSITLDVSAERAWQALPRVYAALEIPIGTLLPDEKVLGNANYSVRRKIGGVTIMKYLDCGGTPGMPNAETFQIALSVLSRVMPTQEGFATVETTVSATGAAPSFGSPPVNCASSFELEKRIHAMLKEQLTK